MSFLIISESRKTYIVWDVMYCMTKEEYPLNFKFIVENCRTVGDLQKLIKEGEDA